MNEMSVDFVSFGIILDDIVFPDGRTSMGVLGGGGPQTAFGMRLWSDRVGIVAGVGKTPSNLLEDLERTGIDLRGVRISDTPTLRAWQILEEDGQRTQLWRIPPNIIPRQLARSIDLLPQEYRNARGYHFGIHPEGFQPNFARALSAGGGLVSIELFRKASSPLPETELRTILESADIFSLNLEEARSVVDAVDPLDILRKLFDSGAKIVTLRMGVSGSLVAHSESREAYQIPAVPIVVNNVVGAGNVYCGGFLVGWQETHDLPTAGLYGATAASFILEQVGFPEDRDKLALQTRDRITRIKSSIQTVIY